MGVPTLKEALDLFNAQRLSEAEDACRRLIVAESRSAGALHLLAIIRFKRNDVPSGLHYMQRAIALDPANPALRHALGLQFLRQSDTQNAIACFEKAVALNPSYMEARFSLAIAYEGAGQITHAELQYRELMRIAPDRAEVFTNIGVLLARCDRMNESIDLLVHATALKPDLAEAQNSLGAAFNKVGEVDRAIEAFKRAIAIKPDLPTAHVNLANALRRKGAFEAAIQICEKARSTWPTFVDAHVVLAASLMDVRRFQEAKDALKKAVALAPNLATLHSDLGHVLTLEGNFHAAIGQLQKTLSMQPDLAEVHHNLAAAFARAGYLDEATAAYQQALALKPDAPNVYSDLLFLLNAHPGWNERQILDAHQGWAKKHAEPLIAEILPWRNDPNPIRPLRIGYVSPDFKKHSIAFFLEPILRSHDRSHYQIYCYSSVARPDEMTRRMQELSDSWRDVLGVSDARLAEQIRADQVDILVDLSVHSAGNRLLAFARKPAPVQVTYLGYTGTTGLPTIDYKLTDAWMDPPEVTDSLQTETLVRLPNCYFCYAPHHKTPLAPLPVLESRRVTFSVFQTLPKISHLMMALWAQILKAVPQSTLWVKALGLQEPAQRLRFEQSFSALGIAPHRLQLDSWGDFDAYLAALQKTDIALDTYPFNGGTTTCHTLWMGVPVVSLAGPRPVSRMGLSMLSTVGLSDFVAQTADEYVNIAVRLANDIDRLTQLRRDLRNRMADSPMMDAPRFARDLESAYRWMWTQWCGRQARQPAR